MSDKNLADRCFEFDHIDMELFDAVNRILGCDTDNCGEAFQCSDTHWDSYDGSVEVIRKDGLQWMTQEEANKILDLGFSIVFETLGQEGRIWSRRGWHPCSARPLDPDSPIERLRAAKKQIERLEKQNKEMADILDGIRHVGPTFNLYTAPLEQRCWDDCPRCQWEALKKEMKG